MNKVEEIEVLETIEPQVEELKAKRKKVSRKITILSILVIFIIFVISLIILSLEEENQTFRVDGVKDIYLFEFEGDFVEGYVVNYTVESNKTYDSIDIKKVEFSKTSLKFIVNMTVVGTPKKDENYEYIFFLNTTGANYTVMYRNGFVEISVYSGNESKTLYEADAKIDNHTLSISFNPEYPGSLLDEFIDIGALAIKEETKYKAFIDFVPDDYYNLLIKKLEQIKEFEKKD